MKIIRTKNTNELRKLINKAQASETNELVIVEGGDDNINRAALEGKKVDILLSPEKGRGKDFTHYRNSGLNQVLCKLANKNNTAIGFNFNDILESRQREIVMGRMMQNIRLCRKYKVKMVFIDEKGKRDKKDLAAFAQTLGMTPGEAKRAVDFIGNFKKKEGNDGVKVVE